MRRLAGRPRADKELQLRAAGDGAQIMKRNGVVRGALGRLKSGWGVPLPAVRGTPSGKRRRLLYGPVARDAQEGEGANVPPGHASQYLDAAYAECAPLFDLKASFFQVGLPAGVLAGFRCCAGGGGIVAPNRPWNFYTPSGESRREARGWKNRILQPQSN
ncbi:putative target of rapamycin (TOR) kinase 1 [Trypanosoma grayi]|uniref:putative target of rapamycin (TOR) kinase 1 n=1 Tax=Trypanosoma grayi TaxID=71804 RepID=UPI0004F40969|nr:putative target of rapamycin (TOR) kinase 1 [Trypanosoma grayi]KEG05730.1 putative target of rapamycin (TOR) kinase 1 [Trypanosoma grayi]